MKLINAIEIAIEHPEFKRYLRERGLSIDSAVSVHGAVASAGKFPDARVIVDFGRPGPSSNDVQFVMDYNENTGSFSVKSMRVG